MHELELRLWHCPTCLLWLLFVYILLSKPSIVANKEFANIHWRKSMYQYCMSVTDLKLIDWVEFILPSACMRLCETLMLRTWFLLLKPNTGDDTWYEIHRIKILALYQVWNLNGSNAWLCFPEESILKSSEAGLKWMLIFSVHGVCNSVRVKPVLKTTCDKNRLDN